MITRRVVMALVLSLVCTACTVPSLTLQPVAAVEKPAEAMTPGVILQINFKFNMSPAELAEAFGPLAEPIAQLPGFRWKIWLLNEAESECGGIYYFDDAESAQAFLGGPIITGLGENPALSDISVKLFDLDALSEYTAITRGPIF